MWRFADCEFDESRHELRVRGRPVELEVKPLEVLHQLLLHAGEVVTKEELLEAVWPDVMVVDASLATAVSKLRKALGEDEHVVVTVPRVGYRLDVPVQTKTLDAAPAWADLQLKPGEPVPGRDQWRLSRRLDNTPSSEVWLAEHHKTHEARVFKFAPDSVRLRGLKREVTLARLLRGSLGDRPEFVRVLEWNFERPPYFVESEYVGPNLAEWAPMQGGLAEVPLDLRLHLLADVARAVAAAHDLAVLHKDLKPGNILVTRGSGGEWQIKVADFGSASLLEPARLGALGITNLGFTQTGATDDSLTGTVMYVAPEVLAGQSPSPATDVYALGVLLYQLVVGDFRKPLAPGWEANVADPLLREDIAEAACGDRARRLKSAAELAERLLHLERRRSEREQREQERQRAQMAARRKAEARARRPWLMISALALVVGLAVGLGLYKRVSSFRPNVRTVAVLPFQNAGSDQEMDFLRFALPDEIATQLSYARSLPIRPFSTTSKYTDPRLDLQKVGQEIRVASIVTGHFLRLEKQLQITLEAVDVENNSLLWRDTLKVSAQNRIAMQEQIAALARGGLAPALGSSAFATDAPTRPKSEEAYDLYLHSAAISNDPAPNREAIGILQRALALDPNYAPGWRALAQRYYYEARYAAGGEDMMQRSEAAAERALALDPNLILAGARLAQTHAERGELTKAYQEAAGLVRQRPDSADAHFTLSYVLRYAGLLDDAASECEAALALDPQNMGWRSCSAVFLVRGDYRRAMDYVNLDRGTEWWKHSAVDILVREGRVNEAVQLGPPAIAQWEGTYSMLLACAQHRPAAEITALAGTIKPFEDPEVNYFFAAHLAYCGQTDPALRLLSLAIKGGYCSYPAVDSDPFFASLRAHPEFVRLRSAAMACQQNFLTQRGQ